MFCFVFDMQQICFVFGMQQILFTNLIFENSLILQGSDYIQGSRAPNSEKLFVWHTETACTQVQR